MTSRPARRAHSSAAIEVASAFGEPLVLVYGAGAPGGVGEEYKSHAEALQEIGRKALAHAVEAADEAGVPTTVEIIDAKPAAGADPGRRQARRAGDRRRQLGREPDQGRDARLDAAQAAAPVVQASAVRTRVRVTAAITPTQT